MRSGVVVAYYHSSVIATGIHRLGDDEIQVPMKGACMYSHLYNTYFIYIKSVVALD